MNDLGQTQTEIDLNRQIAELLGTPWTKPTHGRCCTCQTCGWDYESCQCNYTDNPEKSELLENEIEKRGLQSHYIHWFYKWVCQPEMNTNEETWAIIRATPEQKAKAFMYAMSRERA